MGSFTFGPALKYLSPGIFAVSLFFFHTYFSPRALTFPSPPPRNWWKPPFPPPLCSYRGPFFSALGGPNSSLLAAERSFFLDLVPGQTFPLDPSGYSPRAWNFLSLNTRARDRNLSFSHPRSPLALPLVGGLPSFLPRYGIRRPPFPSYLRFFTGLFGRSLEVGLVAKPTASPLVALICFLSSRFTDGGWLPFLIGFPSLFSFTWEKSGLLISRKKNPRCKKVC